MLFYYFLIVYENKITQPVQMTLNFIASPNLHQSRNNNSGASANVGSNSSTGDLIIQFKTSAYAFLNPCNDAFEFIICTHTNLK
jgi:hypothetical protein